MTKVVVFGGGNFASLAWHSLVHDSDWQVAGFTVDRPYCVEVERHGLPVVPFDALEAQFPPGDHALLVHLGPIGMNRLRRARCDEAVAQGYRLARFQSRRALVAAGVQLGENTVVYEGAIIQPFAQIGRNVILRSGAHVSHHVSIGDDCFIAAGACLGGGASVGAGCFIGLNATIRDGIRIAEGCMIAAGAVVVADTEPDGVYVGVPARRTATPASQMTGF